MRLGLDMDDGVAVSIRGRLMGACALLVLIAAFSGAASSAHAAGKPGTAYVLDIARGSDSGKIYKLNSVTGARQGTVPAPWGPGVPNFRGFFNPVGIKVDAQGYLIVAVSDGYNSQYTYPGDSQFYPCENGCGAILRINPDTGQSVVLTKGPYMTNPYSLVLPADNDITDNDNNYLLVTDNGESQLVRVNLNGGLGTNPEANQSIAYPSAGGNLFKPWGIARNGSQVMVANTGLTFTKSYGHLSRFTDSGDSVQFNGRVTSSEYRHPRGLTNALGKFYVSDPFVTSGGFGIIFGISGSRTDYVSAGDKLRTPSGMSLDYTGKYLLVTDENFNDPGKVFRVRVEDGLQTTFASNVGSGPIDVAVDRRKAPKPPVKPQNSIRPLASFQRDETTNYGALEQGTGRLLGDGALKILNLTPGARLRLQCVSRLCRQKLRIPRPLDARIKKSFHIFDFRSEQTGRYLTGRFRVIEYARGGRLRGKRYAGVYREYAFRGRFIRVKQGCLKPGSRAVSRRSIVNCPA